MYRAVIVIIALMFAPAVAAAQQPCTTDAHRVVNELYRHMLERQADPASEHWVEQLRSGRMTVREVVRQIARSEEHVNRFFQTEAGESTPYERAVGTFYRHILGRQPDAAGQRAFAQVAQRRGPQAVIDQFVTSPEYNERFGDWGVPGSGGLAFCPPAATTSALAPALERQFAAMDRNDDGVLTRREWRGSTAEFHRRDLNGDGVLTAAEFANVPGVAGTVGVTPEIDRQFHDMDRNRDGATSQSEWRGTTSEFNRRDLNGDRTLDLSEFAGVVGTAGVTPGIQRRFDRLDRNDDGVISRREWRSSAVQFRRRDLNGDGVLDLAEFAGASGVVGTPSGVAGTSGQFVVIDPTQAWTDTEVAVLAGDLIRLDADGTIQLSDEFDDVAAPGGASRRALNAPLPLAPAGGLLLRIGGSSPIFVGDRRSIRAPVSGRILLGVNDDFFPDNTGEFRVSIVVEPR